jgi:hypothetical protein
MLEPLQIPRRTPEEQRLLDAAIKLQRHKGFFLPGEEPSGNTIPVAPDTGQPLTGGGSMRTGGGFTLPSGEERQEARREFQFASEELQGSERGQEALAGGLGPFLERQFQRPPAARAGAKITRIDPEAVERAGQPDWIAREWSERWQGIEPGLRRLEIAGQTADLAVATVAGAAGLAAAYIGGSPERARQLFVGPNAMGPRIPNLSGQIGVAGAKFGEEVFELIAEAGDFTEARETVSERFRELPLMVQVVLGVIFDPAALIPLGTGVKALSGAIRFSTRYLGPKATRKAVEAALKRGVAAGAGLSDETTTAVRSLFAEEGPVQALGRRIDPVAPVYASGDSAENTRRAVAAINRRRAQRANAIEQLGEGASEEDIQAFIAQGSTPAPVPVAPVPVADDVTRLANAAEANAPSEVEFAVTRFTGIADRTQGFGIMNALPFEGAYSAAPSPESLALRGQIDAAFAPVREELRALYGDNITLYRSQRALTGDEEVRNVLSWSSNREFVGAHAGEVPDKTEWYIRGGVGKTSQEIETDAAFGVVPFRSRATAEKFLKDHPGVDIHGDEVINPRIEEVFVPGKGPDARHEIIEQSVPLDDVVWVTDRANQKEFIVRTTPDTPRVFTDAEIDAAIASLSPQDPLGMGLPADMRAAIKARREQAATGTGVTEARAGQPTITPGGPRVTDTRTARPGPNWPLPEGSRPGVYGEPPPSALAGPGSGGARRPPTQPPASTFDDARQLPPEQVPEVFPTTVAGSVIGMDAITTGLTRVQTIKNVAKETVFGKVVGAVPDDPIATAPMLERRRVQPNINSVANSVGIEASEVVRRRFLDLDESGGAWTVPRLAGVDPTVPGAPTIADIAARLPRYEPVLTQAEREAMEFLRLHTDRFTAFYESVGLSTPIRGDIIEGGFYLPRGGPHASGGFDIPARVTVDGRRREVSSFTQPAKFDSQAEGLAGKVIDGKLHKWEYPPPGEALENYARSSSRLAVNEHVANFFRQAVDEDGNVLGKTLKMRMLERSPVITQTVEGLKIQRDRLRTLHYRMTDRQNEVFDKFIDDPFFTDVEGLRDAMDVKAAADSVAPGASVREINETLKAIDDELRALAPDYERALNRAKGTALDEGIIQLPEKQLDGHTFPIELANAANAIIKAETKAVPVIGPTAEAINRIYRALGATADNSAPGIQGLLGMASDNSAWREALKISVKAWLPTGEWPLAGRAGDRAIASFILDYNEIAVANGRLTSDQWGAHGLAILGSRTEFSFAGAGGLTSKFKNVPIIKQADRAFGGFGDALRLGWADDMLAEELSRQKWFGRWRPAGGQKRTIQEVIDSGDMRRIADAINNGTGVARTPALGTVGDVAFFAAKFLQSRINTVAKAGLSLRPGASLDQRIARKSLIKMIGYGTVMTFALNEALGNETDTRLFIDGKLNPNFMRVRVGGRDVSLFGTWHSLLTAFIVTAQGRPDKALRNLGGGIVSMTWDMATGSDAIGQPVRSDKGTFAAWALGQTTPFASQELPSAIRQFREGDVAEGGLTVGLETFGAKSAPVTLAEQRGIEEQRVIRGLLNEGTLDQFGPEVMAAAQEGDLQAMGGDARRLVKEDPSVASIQDAIDEQQRRKGSPYQGYKDERDTINTKFDARIENLGVKVGEGQAFREQFAVHNRDRSKEHEINERNNAEALEFLEDLDPATAEFDRALAAYIAVVDDPSLEDFDTGEYDFKKREDGIQDAIINNPEWGPQMLERILAHLRRVEPAIVRQLRADRELLKEYWEIGRDPETLIPGRAVSAQLAKDWKKYLDAGKHDRLRIEQENRDVARFVARREHLRQKMRRDRSNAGAIDIALLRWEYSTSPATREGKDFLDRKFDEGLLDTSPVPSGTTIPFEDNAIPVAPDTIPFEDNAIPVPSGTTIPFTP